MISFIFFQKSILFKASTFHFLIKKLHFCFCETKDKFGLNLRTNHPHLDQSRVHHSYIFFQNIEPI